MGFNQARHNPEVGVEEPLVDAYRGIIRNGSDRGRIIGTMIDDGIPFAPAPVPAGAFASAGVLGRCIPVAMMITIWSSSIPYWLTRSRNRADNHFIGNRPSDVANADRH